ncbi:MAG: hypothetical protein ICV73_07510, partial [Acetobacteraceae bacterium]|nr:hypothetical protein [Acetobacteraceae bacterium]
MRRLCAALAILTALLLLAAWAATPTLRVDIAPDQIRPFANLPYTAPVRAPGFPYVVSSDALGGNTNSRLALYENGTRLGPAHARHDLIRDVGQGAYSHWGRTLIFSASDNTDPRTNGRRYSLEAAAELSPAFVGFATAVLLVASAGFLLTYAGALRALARAVRRAYARRPRSWTAAIRAVSGACFSRLRADGLLDIAHRVLAGAVILA